MANAVFDVGRHMMFRERRSALARRCTAVFHDGDVTDGFQYRHVRNGRATT
jgi:hypothetical protein